MLCNIICLYTRHCVLRCGILINGLHGCDYSERNVDYTFNSVRISSAKELRMTAVPH